MSAFLVQFLPIILCLSEFGFACIFWALGICRNVVLFLLGNTSDVISTYWQTIKSNVAIVLLIFRYEYHILLRPKTTFFNIL